MPLHFVMGEWYHDCNYGVHVIIMVSLFIKKTTKNGNSKVRYPKKVKVKVHMLRVGATLCEEARNFLILKTYPTTSL